MALVLQEIYSSVVEESMRIVYDTLSEKDRRRYVAVEALKLGWGGQTYLAAVVGCSRRTVANGISELAWRTTRPIAQNSIQLNGVSFRTSRGPAKAFCLTAWKQ